MSANVRDDCRARQSRRATRGSQQTQSNTKAVRQSTSYVECKSFTRTIDTTPWTGRGPTVSSGALVAWDPRPPRVSFVQTELWLARGQPRPQAATSVTGPGSKRPSV